MGVVFKRGAHFDKSAKNHPEVRQKFEAFVQSKAENPMAPFGGSDKLFVGKGAFGRYISGLRHAHLTQDISIVYAVKGGDPLVILLYGFYSHAELGTSRPPNMNKQQSMAQKFSNTTFEGADGARLSRKNAIC